MLTCKTGSQENVFLHIKVLRAIQAAIRCILYMSDTDHLKHTF